MKKIFLVLITGSLMAITSIGQADTLPAYYPKTFAIFGTLGSIDTKSQTISINDRNKHYDLNIKVHTQNSQFSSLDALRPGMNVGASLSAGEPRITEIWVLPEGYRPPLPSTPR